MKGIRSITPYSLQIREIADQKNSEYGYFLRSGNLANHPVITAPQCSDSHWKEPELRLCTTLNSVSSVSKVWDDGNIWQWPRLEIRPNTHWTIMLQKQLSIIIIVIIIIIIIIINESFQMWHILIEHFLLINPCSI